MTKKDTLQSIARKVTGDETLKCNTVRNALHCIAEEAKGEATSCKTINEALTCIDENIENLIGGDRVAEALTITENGVTTTPTGKFYNPITVNVPSAADLEANKEVTITTNGTHEITPTEGKDGMEKATVTVNVPSSGKASAYYWKKVKEGGSGEAIEHYFSFDKSPADLEAFNASFILNSRSVGSCSGLASTYTKISDEEFHLTVSSGPGEGTWIYTRDDYYDYTLWEVSD